MQARIAFPCYDLVLLSVPTCTGRLSCPFSIAQSLVHIARFATRSVMMQPLCVLQFAKQADMHS